MIAFFTHASTLRQKAQRALFRLSGIFAAMNFLMIYSRTLFRATLVGAVLALASCSAPKVAVPEKAPVPKEKVAENPEANLPEDTPTPLPDDGLRMGNMLALPTDGDFRTTNPNLVRPANPTGPVIARPPTDPPSRVKPTPTDAE